jgi:hypothetical protein
MNAHANVKPESKVDPLAIPEAEREAAKRMSKDMVDLCKLDWPLVILSPYDPALVARAQLPDADRETKQRAKASGKAPFGNDWQNKATSNWNDLKGWARDALDHFGRCPNIGALAGAYIPPRDGRLGGYLLPVDIDVKGPDGKPVTTREARRADLETKIGAPLPETVSDDSPSGGGHEWFLSPNPLSVTQKIALIEGVDIPHQAAIAPSTRGCKAYVWRKGCAPWERAIAIAPPELLAFIIKQRERSAVDKATGRAKIAEGANIDSVANRARYRDWLDKYAPEAVENEGKHKTAIGILQRGKDEGLSAVVAAAIAHDSAWNRTRCHPSYELDRLIQMSETSDASRQNEVGSRSPEAVFVDLSPEQTEEMKKAEADRKAEQDAARKEAEDPDLSKYGIGHGRALRVEPPRYLIKNWLNLGATSSWFGPPKSGKSATLVNCAVHVAAGRDWVGCKAKRALVVYLAYERGEETEERYLAACEKLGLSQDLPFVVVKRPPLLKTTNGAEILVGVIEKLKNLHGQELVFIVADTLTAAAPGEDLDGSTGMSAVLNRLQHVRDHFDAHLTSRSMSSTKRSR